MAGAASGLIEALQLALPDSDWVQIPINTASWFCYGGGGIAGSGSLCGVPNGCCVVLNMLGLKALTGQVLLYYSNEVFPTSGVPDAYDSSWTGPVPIPDGEVLAHTTALSPLCHISISKWCDAADVRLTDKDDENRVYKLDRCGKVCADMAAFTAELINNGTASTQSDPPGLAECIDCHNTSADSVLPAQVGNMWCGHCHEEAAVIV